MLLRIPCIYSITRHDHQVFSTFLPELHSEFIAVLYRSGMTFLFLFVFDGIFLLLFWFVPHRLHKTIKIYGMLQEFFNWIEWEICSCQLCYSFYEVFLCVRGENSAILKTHSVWIVLERTRITTPENQYNRTSLHYFGNKKAIKTIEFRKHAARSLCLSL